MGCYCGMSSIRQPDKTSPVSNYLYGHPSVPTSTIARNFSFFPLHSLPRHFFSDSNMVCTPNMTSQVKFLSSLPSLLLILTPTSTSFRDVLVVRVLPNCQRPPILFPRVTRCVFTDSIHLNQSMNAHRLPIVLY